MSYKTVFKSHWISLLVLAVVASMPAAGAGKQGIRIYDKGLVEGSRFYQVICKDGKRVSVRHVFDVPPAAAQPPSLGGELPIVPGSGSRTPGPSTTYARSVEICAYPYSEGAQCKVNWSVDEAARFACDRK